MEIFLFLALFFPFLIYWKSNKALLLAGGKSKDKYSQGCFCVRIFYVRLLLWKYI